MNESEKKALDKSGAAQALAVSEKVKLLPAEKLGRVHIDITEFSESAAKLLEQAERAEIKDAKDYATGGDLIKIARTNKTAADELRKELSAPYHGLWKFINSQFKPVDNAFDAVRTVIEKKMLAWKQAEDKRLADEAKKEQERIEAEALERAAAEKSEEGADEVMDTAAEAVEKVEEKASVGLQRGSYGSSTGTKMTYSTNVTDAAAFLQALIGHINSGNKRNIDINAIVEFKKGGLNKLAENCIKAGVKKMPGAEFVGTDKIRVY